MGKKTLTTREDDFPQWYQEVIKDAQLAQNSPVRGCMIIRPYGYGIWENVQRDLDERIKDTGHENAYFPLLIPKSYLEREAEHVEGFAKECAIVTHHRLVEGPEGGLIPDPEAKLDEPFVIRPTSETIIGEAYSQWVESYKDLPILINQWANVMRWELRTRMFLRTSEFLWQEGHTAHETAEEARQETMKMLEVYRAFAEESMAMPVICGEKPRHERFPGAVQTFSIEAMMQDRKALQAGTSHDLGQNFSRQFDIKYASRNQTQELAWTTSWGMSTRMIGGLIMTHGDDAGLIVPPRVAPIHIVIVPIARKDEDLEKIRQYLAPLLEKLAKQRYHDRKIRVRFDDRTHIRTGPKFFEWERKGVPLRLEVGPRDIEKDELVFVRRDLGEKTSINRDAFADKATALLDEMQSALFEKAKSFRDANTRQIDDPAEFEAFFTPKNKKKPEIHGGFVRAHFNDCEEALNKLKSLKLTVRCVPLGEEDSEGTCVLTGRPSKKRVIYAKAY